MDSKDARIEAALRAPEQAIGDDDFTQAVFERLPAKRFSQAAARRWTLGGAALAGSVLTSVIGAPLETAFSSLVLGGGVNLTAVGILFVIGMLAIPVAWTVFSR